MTSLYDEYEGYVIKYKQEYGDNTIVLYRCGSFYEIYSANDGLVDIKGISELLNIQMSKKNKAILEVNRSNTLMAGFPMYTLQKFVNMLVAENYTVVIVDQISDPPKPKRAVTAVISPGTDITNINTPDANYLMAIFFENSVGFKTKKNIISVGISFIDLSTGKSKVFEFGSSNEDTQYALDEVYRIIQAENPKEIILLGDKLENNIVDYLELKGRCVHERWGLYDSEIGKLSYQKQFLEKIFPNHGLLSVIEYLDLEKTPLATISFVFLLRFAFKHNDAILEKINKPLLSSKDSLILSYNSIKHLNIVPTDELKNNSLLHLLNKAQTSIGKRLFKDLILNPISDVEELNKRYDIVDYYIKNYILVEETRNILSSKIYDIERLSRKMHLKTLNPCELLHIYSTVSGIIEIINGKNIPINLNKNYHKNEYRCLLDGLLNEITSTIDMIEVQKYNLDNLSRSFFNKGIYDDIDKEQEKVDKLTNYFEDLSLQLNKCIGIDQAFKVDTNLNDGYHLVITNKRFQDNKGKLKDFIFGFDNFIFDFKSITQKQTNTTLRLYHKSFDKINESLDKKRNDLILLIKDNYIKFIENFINKNNDILSSLIDFIGYIDFYTNAAKLAKEYKYCRPSIANDNTHSKSYINATDVRHPIIERLCTDTSYVANDVKLGTDDTRGILLYGTNMVGKSSYMKSIGLSIIIAQCGMFVPASTFEYYPYKSIFTRIPSGDDLFKGLSTFAVEISELRNILKRADKNSLVIGDELASGTESISAVSIVGAGIVQLYEREASFVFATHLHDLTSLNKFSTGTPLMKIFHLSVVFDDINKKLVFDRKLREGQGNTLYGLEVCRALDMGNDFISIANQFRHELLGIDNDILSTKASKYNNSLYIDQCSICNKKASEVHHIKQQASADADGFITYIHKNDKSNLINVCNQCHDKIHNNEIQVQGFYMTTNGKELILNQGNNSICNNGSVGTIVGNNGIDNIEDDTLRNQIKDLRMKKISFAKIREELTKSGINISLYKVKKIWGEVVK